MYSTDHKQLNTCPRALATVSRARGMALARSRTSTCECKPSRERERSISGPEARAHATNNWCERTRARVLNAIRARAC